MSDLTEEELIEIQNHRVALDDAAAIEQLMRRLKELESESSMTLNIEAQDKRIAHLESALKRLSDGFMDVLQEARVDVSIDDYTPPKLLKLLEALK